MRPTLIRLAHSAPFAPTPKPALFHRIAGKALGATMWFYVSQIPLRHISFDLLTVLKDILPIQEQRRCITRPKTSVGSLAP